MYKIRFCLRSVAAIAVCLAVTVFASCGKDDDLKEAEADIPVFPVFLLEEVQESTARYVFEYDGKNRMTKLTGYLFDSCFGRWYQFLVHELKYNVVGDLEEYTYRTETNVTKFTIHKDGNKFTLSDDTATEIRFIELNAHGLPEKCAYLIGVKGSESWNFDIRTYTWHNGNNTKLSVEQDWKYGSKEDTWSGTYTYTFDDKKSPFYYCTTPKWILLHFWGSYYSFNDNNIIDHKLEDSVYLTTEYTYNDYGFPVTQTYSHTTNTTTYTYKKIEK